jgi:uncharacterized protein
VKFQPDHLDGVNAITRFDGHQLWVGNTMHQGSVLVPWQGAVLPWAPSSFEQLAASHFDNVLALQPELVIFGSGARQRFPSPALLAALMGRRVGVETMDSAAACRTYNVLAHEGRHVVAALLLDPPA